ncbi:hypothetical protein ASD64_13990 [Mesorhizobium sp. Root157]|uniref:DUF454 family protein n=1 Tax=Mesorhizobium sp. Root157 TaxID=1736477 RepID=UPI0006FEA1A2|nr:DUF454 family protein [Mesorhizobium sp. Root157]KQZ99914.1 hypothetical protein ASD64_13990 [Mesorhizobium sp. Root157]
MPFIILAAYFFAKSAPVLHEQPAASQTFGKAIRDWRDKRPISCKGKIAALVTVEQTLVCHLQ